MNEHETDDMSRDRTCPYCDEEDPSEAHGIDRSKKATTDYTDTASLPADELLDRLPDTLDPESTRAGAKLVGVYPDTGRTRYVDYYDEADRVVVTYALNPEPIEGQPLIQPGEPGAFVLGDDESVQEHVAAVLDMGSPRYEAVAEWVLEEGSA